MPTRKRSIPKCSPLSQERFISWLQPKPTTLLRLINIRRWHFPAGLQMTSAQHVYIWTPYSCAPVSCYQGHLATTYPAQPKTCCFKQPVTLPQFYRGHYLVIWHQAPAEFRPMADEQFSTMIGRLDEKKFIFEIDQWNANRTSKKVKEQINGEISV